MALKGRVLSLNVVSSLHPRVQDPYSEMSICRITEGFTLRLRLYLWHHMSSEHEWGHNMLGLWK
jgi:hypothetical protein